jgi:hypothetical protein
MEKNKTRHQSKTTQQAYRLIASKDVDRAGDKSICTQAATRHPWNIYSEVSS